MRKLKICDTHNDFLTELEPCEFESYISGCKASGVKRICASYWSTRREKPKEELLGRSELLRNLDSDFLLHIEDLWWVKDEKDLKFLTEMKPFSCSLTWNGSNVLAGGCGSKAGLSQWGKCCLEKLVENEITVDVAHLNRKSFWQVAKIVKDNIYCSHAGFYGVRRQERNLTDKQIDFIVRSNGFVGLFFFDKCVQGRNNKNGARPFGVDDIVQNLRYFSDRWGFDNIGIGTDFYGIDNPPQGLDDYGGFEKLFAILKKAGFSERQIEKIFYQNFEDFLTRIHCLSV